MAVSYTHLSQVLPNIKAVLKENSLENQFSELLEMRVGRIRTTEEYDNAYSCLLYTSSGGSHEIKKVSLQHTVGRLQNLFPVCVQHRISVFIKNGFGFPLDVYKRQVYTRYIATALRFCFVTGVVNCLFQIGINRLFGAVSYTHLDVYKRQKHSSTKRKSN